MPNELIIKPAEKGYSKLLEVQGRKGRFNWDIKPQFNPEIAKGKSPMHSFETITGDTFWLRLEKNKQGGRWETAPHAFDEWQEWKKNPALIVEHWGENTSLTKALNLAIQWNLPFENLSEFLKPYDTWRQISGD